MRSFDPSMFGRPAIMSTTLHEAERAYLSECKERVLDELEIAVVDGEGRRFKEREVRAAMKTVARL